MAQTEDSSAKPPSGMSEIQAYSIFYENYRSDSYEMAAKFGRWIWKGMPETIEGYSKFDLKKNLNRLTTIYGGLAEEAQDPSLKEAYVDTALLVCEKTLEKYAGDQETEFEWYINRGRIYQKYSDIVVDASTLATQDYLKAFELKPEEFTQKSDGYYVRVMLQELVSAGEKDQALAVVKKAEPYASMSVKNFFDDIRDQLFDSPQERIAFLEGERKENPEDQEVLTQLRELYQEQEMRDKASEVSEELYKLDPSFENTMAVADVAISNANYNMAIEYLKEAMGKATENQQKAEIALKISNAYMNKEELQTARQYARQAIDYDSEWGEPYLKIADIYAQAVSQCTSDRKLGREDKAVYWLVLDYLDKAKRVDANTANEVSRKYKSYEPVTPTEEEKFFWKPPLKTGDNFNIDSSLMKCYGWISETTTVR